MVACSCAAICDNACEMLTKKCMRWLAMLGKAAKIAGKKSQTPKQNIPGSTACGFWLVDYLEGAAERLLLVGPCWTPVC